jgi:hypothetical protein
VGNAAGAETTAVVDTGAGGAVTGERASEPRVAGSPTGDGEAALTG